MTLTHLDPGWLAKSIAEAGRELRRMRRPMELVQYGQAVTIPLSAAHAADLYADLNAHFFAWTGQSLDDYRRVTRG